LLSLADGYFKEIMMQVDDTHHRNYTSLSTTEFLECPLQLPELVQMEDMATHVFTDFTHNRPAVIPADSSIDVAMQMMKNSGIHLLLVIDKMDADTDSTNRLVTVKGQITSCDALGDAPVKLARENGINHNEMTVSMVMTPNTDIKVVDWSTIKVAKVGHIIKTMHDWDCCHILVMDEDRLRGIFSMSEISKHLGHNESEPLVCAHSLAELVHTIG
jgi:CBS domain-containing protein